MSILQSSRINRYPSRRWKFIYSLHQSSRMYNFHSPSAAGPRVAVAASVNDKARRHLMTAIRRRLIAAAAGLGVLAAAAAANAQGAGEGGPRPGMAWDPG